MTTHPWETSAPKPQDMKDTIALDDFITAPWTRKQVSVVITNYNRAKYIARAIRSCLNQLIFNKSLEIIVVDDCSTDDSLEVLSHFENLITIVAHRTNRGVAAASNTGLRHAKGEYFMRVDADDYLNRDAINIMSKLLDENDEIDLVYSDLLRVTEEGYLIEKIQMNNTETLLEHGAGVLFRRSVIEKAGGYDETLRNCEDYDLLAKILKKSNGFYIPIPFYRYYMHNANISQKSEREFYKQKVRERHGI
jgi:glycosyltransferase involved in cell wall biosynthesis